ncbi:MAG: hypothetical protein C0601_01125 [Candidatus Muiribacterium halophilum]|uniref:Type II secretion system protein GspH n=1 Tax=Muiribacterium halophilum TaxID=2053465 RepID=A0A2N5ZM72_MUIH1|nr:MAG: hypothetical protein C0601_01125 [Candidatus Muirbacterium halophilum]
MKNRGFTLLELMVSVVIIGILASVGTANFLKFKEDYDVDSAQSILVSDLMLARELSKTKNELYLEDSYQKIYYALEIKSDKEYVISLLTKDYSKIKEYAQERSLSKGGNVKFDLVDDMQNLFYIVFKWDGEVVFLDAELNEIEPPGEGIPEIVIKSVNSDYKAEINIDSISGKFNYE